MAIIGIICCLLGAGIIVYSAKKTPTLMVPYMVWGFCVFIIGILFILTSIDWIN